jgi:pimeloyl-ACP methyl ester carboxylesterase
MQRQSEFVMTGGMRKAAKLVLLGAVLATLPVAFVATRGRSYLYYPTHISDTELHTLAARPGWRLDRLRVDSDVALNGLIRPPSAADAPWLLLFGGTSMDLGSGQSILERVAGEADWGLAVWAFRGYDGSGGNPTQDGLFGDAEAQIAHLQSAYSVRPEALVLLGQSLGSGVAAHAAAWLHDRGTPPAALALLSPYTSIARLVDNRTPVISLGWAMPDSFHTDRLVERIAGPVLIIHGTDDGLIPIRHGEELAAGFGERAELLRLEGVGHTGLWDDESTVDSIRQLVREHAGAGHRPARPL